MADWQILMFHSCMSTSISHYECQIKLKNSLHSSIRYTKLPETATD